GGVRERGARDLVVVEPVPAGLAGEGEADLRDARVVGVQDDAAGFVALRRQRLLDLFRDGLELAVAVELVAEEVEDDRGLRLDLFDRPGQARLVDLEHAPVGAEPAVGAGAAERGGGGAEDEVGAGAVADHAVTRAFEQPRDQARGRRLAVGAGDEDRSMREVARQPREDLRVDRARDVAGQRRPAAAPRDAAERAGRLAREDSGLLPQLHGPTACATVVHTLMSGGSSVSV